MFRGLPITHKYLYVLHTEDFPLSPNTCIMQTFIYNFRMRGPVEMRQFHAVFHLTHWAWRSLFFYFAFEDLHLCWLFVFACRAQS